MDLSPFPVSNPAVRPVLTIDYTVAPPPVLDFGDAPDTYGTVLSSNGARHSVGGPHLGATVDGETDGQPSASANRDQDDDGVFPIANMVALPATSTTASFRIIASQAAKLDAWIDFNQDGTFDQLTEHLGGTSRALVAGDNVVTFTVPSGAMSGQTYGRFRISSAGGLGPKGLAPDGEVEDYALSIFDGRSTPVTALSLPSGSSAIALVGADLVARNGAQELFRAPSSAVGQLDVASPLADAAVSLTGGWTLGAPLFVGADFFRMATQSGVTVHIAGLHPWQNPVKPSDVNNSGNVTPLDVLLCINWINSRGVGDLPVPPTPAASPDEQYLDINGDDNITPLDNRQPKPKPSIRR